MTSQTALFEPAEQRFEYYPLLIPSDETLGKLREINEWLGAQEGIKPSQLTKLHHISIDGKITFENDIHIIRTITEAVQHIEPLVVEFGEVISFPGMTVCLSIGSPAPVLKFNQALMTSLEAKTTKLKLHLTIARYANPSALPTFTAPGIPYPSMSVFDKIVVYKRPYKSKERYQTIATIRIGEGKE